MSTSPDPVPHRSDLLAGYLRSLLGDADPADLDQLRDHLQWTAIAGGQTLMAQGDAGDAMYLVVSGRLRVYVRDDAGAQRAVRELGRGQVVGEMSLFTDEPRSATIVAIRDAVLVRLAKPAFARLLATSPPLSMALTRQVIERLRTEHQRAPAPRPVTIGVMAITAGVDAAAFTTALAEALRAIDLGSGRARVQVVDAQRVSAEAAVPAGDNDRPPDPDTGHTISQYLDRLEARSDFVLLIADGPSAGWTGEVARHSDELLLLADAGAPPVLHPLETRWLTDRPQRAEAAETLVLMHPAGTAWPTGTARWLDRRPVAHHVHLRAGDARDLARLARLLSRTAVGLVLAGGGARGFAHLGIAKALQAQGVEIDCVGGTSIGAVMAAYVACDQPLDRVLAHARKWFGANPTGDYNLLPLLSLIKGRRLRGIFQAALPEIAGPGASIEDLWKTCFCVATNVSQAREMVIQRGDAAHSLLASLSIPGALPPVVHDGDLLSDGGTLNNFPVDVMRGLWGVGCVIGVDLHSRRPRRIETDEIPGTWALLRDRMRPRSRRRYRLPSMASSLMTATILYSLSRQRESQQMTDVYFNPPLDRVGLLQWNRFTQIVEQGHAHGLEVLDTLAEPLRRRLGMPPAG